MVRRLEALADAIIHFARFNDPESSEYQSRNPGGLTAFSPKHPKNSDGKRVFRSFLDGYQALLFDLAVKCIGKSNTKLTQESSLDDLMNVYGKPHGTARYVAKFLKKALHDDSLSEKTQLSYFVSEAA